mmetsp:Transcript_14836/g.42010  ORF Transcript_14836/g.42010 Transcript_14836/m.42010 type:complete len:250 (+) Transcript_14836:1170-1919(+)
MAIVQSPSRLAFVAQEGRDLGKAIDLLLRAAGLAPVREIVPKHGRRWAADGACGALGGFQSIPRHAVFRLHIGRGCLQTIEHRSDLKDRSGVLDVQMQVVEAANDVPECEPRWLGLRRGIGLARLADTLEQILDGGELERPDVEFGADRPGLQHAFRVPELSTCRCVLASDLNPGANAAVDGRGGDSGILRLFEAEGLLEPCEAQLDVLHSRHVVSPSSMPTRSERWTPRRKKRAGLRSARNSVRGETA